VDRERYVAAAFVTALVSFFLTLGAGRAPGASVLPHGVRVGVFGQMAFALCALVKGKTAEIARHSAKLWE